MARRRYSPRTADHITDLDYGAAEVILEGFPDLTPQAFVSRYFIDAQGIAPEALVTRVEWRYLDA